MPDPARGKSADAAAPLAPAFVHATAVVDPGATLGAGVKVWHFAHVCAGADVGERSVLGQNVYVGPGVRIGRGCKIQNNVSVYEGVTLDDDVFVGPSAVFTNVRNPRAHVVRRHEFAPTRVGRHSTIGANATIVCGVTLAEGAFVAAGAVVTKDVAPFALVRGVPAAPWGYACRCGEILPGLGKRARGVRCPSCGASYLLRGEGNGLGGLEEQPRRGDAPR